MRKKQKDFDDELHSLLLSQNRAMSLMFCFQSPFSCFFMQTLFIPFLCSCPSFSLHLFFSTFLLIATDLVLISVLPAAVPPYDLSWVMCRPHKLLQQTEVYGCSLVTRIVAQQDGIEGIKNDAGKTGWGRAEQQHYGVMRLI